MGVGFIPRNCFLHSNIQTGIGRLLGGVKKNLYGSKMSRSLVKGLN